MQQLRLQVDERGGGLGAAPFLRIGVRATHLVFLGRGSPPYRLALGNADAVSAALPLETLIPGFRPQRLEQLATAEVVAGAKVQAMSPPGSAPDWKRWGLWVVLLLGVAVLGLMAASLLRRAPSH